MTDPARRGRYAIILHHNRHTDLVELVNMIGPQVDMVVVHDNASTPPVTRLQAVGDPMSRDWRTLVAYCADQPPNLARFWNNALAVVEMHARRLGEETWDVALLNDDAKPYPGWFALAATAMRERGAAAACTLPGRTALLVEPDGNLGRRLYGPAFVVRGEIAGRGKLLEAEERLAWWFQDSDMDFKARRAGGTLIVSGNPVPNIYANQSTVGERAEQAGRDREAFREIWGFTW